MKWRRLARPLKRQIDGAETHPLRANWWRHDDKDDDKAELRQLPCCCYVDKFKAAVMLTYWWIWENCNDDVWQALGNCMVFCKHACGNESIRSGDGYGVWCVCCSSDCVNLDCSLSVCLSVCLYDRLIRTITCRKGDCTSCSALLTNKQTNTHTHTMCRRLRFWQLC